MVYFHENVVGTCTFWLGPVGLGLDLGLALAQRADPHDLQISTDDNNFTTALCFAPKFLQGRPPKKR